ncbi:hypothetical protein ACTHAL_000491 [Priestia flexa]|uniref:hypothetical protein n=1 Tax=Priestia flexa TaxID=86664 RepID=UPI003F870C7D
MAEKKRVQVTFSQDNYDTIEEVADRYGITVNAFMAFILGQWADQYKIQKAFIEDKRGLIPDLDIDEVLTSPLLFKQLKKL